MVLCGIVKKEGNPVMSEARFIGMPGSPKPAFCQLADVRTVRQIGDLKDD